MKDKRMAQVIDGRTISVGEILGGAAQDTNGAQLKFEQVRDSDPPVFEAKGTDNKIYSFEMTSISVRLFTMAITSSSSSYPDSTKLQCEYSAHNINDFFASLYRC